MDKNSNAYTFIFAIAMVIVVAVTLSFTATSLQPMQAENVRQEKMQSILSTFVGDSVTIDGQKQELSRSVASKIYDDFILEELTLDNKGDLKEGENAFQVNLAKQLSLEEDKQTFPLYVAEFEGSRFYVVPLRGTGLWDAIWGYVALKEDANTIEGVIFDHKGETAGLGAEITTDWFQERFVNEQIYNESGEIVGVEVVKGYGGGDNKDDNKVDAISGATITGDGVSKMMENRLKHYKPYFEKVKKSGKVATR
ncbi:NADH:ubiquinone reductase (Na(+)-transporting) subunit C [Psychroflexus aestuariivivens]|uniref:NADH:ubiquinone reductase (Na(+)-transporting) subunit C n=1 Tax=Psychroflexus aestuariivivens TaxID=1795040 RepID=UPI000FDB39EA|nr:NADH:ubiquinone reductase (Na(+)-transporting) subunit C [Psychroflexus aestuariivivens]